MYLQMGRWELWDFNPYRVRRLGKDFIMESENASLSVKTKGTLAKCRGLEDGEVYSLLPFVRNNGVITIVWVYMMTEFVVER